MKKFVFALALTTVFGVVAPGCDSKGSNSVVTENADEKAKAAYEAEIKANEEAMKQSMQKK